MSQVARNTLFLTIASIGQKLIAFVYFTIIANMIGKGSTGDYFLALSITTIFSVVADWGLNPVLIREIAKDKGKASELLQSVLLMKIPLIVLGGLGSIAMSKILGYSNEITFMVILATLVMAADSVSLSCFGVLRGLQNLRYESIGIFIGQSITTIFGLLVLIINPWLPLLIIALFAGSFWNAIYSAIQVAKKINPKALIPKFNNKIIPQLLKMSIAFFLAGAFVKVYSYVDSILLSQYLGSEAVGTYAVAYKITYAFQFLPMAFVGALYPAMAHLWGRGTKQELANLFENSVWYVTILASPIVFGIFSLADKIVPFFYRDGYEDSVVPLKILIFVLLVIFADFPAGSLLNAANRQGTKTAILGATMVINVVANLILIPKFGINGACIAALISFSFLLLAGLAFIPGLLNYSLTKLFIRIGPIIMSGVAMSLVVIILKPMIHFIILVPIGAIVYVAMLLLTKSVHKNDWEKAKSILKKPNSVSETI